MTLPPPPLTVREVADYLGVGDDVVRALIKNKKLKAIKVGGRWRIFRADLAEYVISKMEKPRGGCGNTSQHRQGHSNVTCTPENNEIGNAHFPAITLLK